MRPKSRTCSTFCKRLSSIHPAAILPSPTQIHPSVRSFPYPDSTLKPAPIYSSSNLFNETHQPKTYTIKPPLINTSIHHLPLHLFHPPSLLTVNPFTYESHRSIPLLSRPSIPHCLFPARPSIHALPPNNQSIQPARHPQ